MPAGYDLEGAGMMPDQGAQMRDILAQIMQAQQSPQGAAPTIAEVWKQGVHEMPQQMPDLPPRDGAAPQQPAPQLPGQNPFQAPPPGYQQTPSPAVPGLGPQSGSAFKLPGKMARLNPLDEEDPRDIVGRGSAGTA